MVVFQWIFKTIATKILTSLAMLIFTSALVFISGVPPMWAAYWGLGFFAFALTIIESLDRLWWSKRSPSILLEPTGGPAESLHISITNLSSIDRSFSASCKILDMHGSNNKMAIGPYQPYWFETNVRTIKIGSGATSNLVIATLLLDRYHKLGEVHLKQYDPNKFQGTKVSERWDLTDDDGIAFELELAISASGYPTPCRVRYRLETGKRGPLKLTLLS